MKLIVCVSNNNGMMFNNRRQSRDKTLIKKIMDMTNGDTVAIHPYSQSLFVEYEPTVGDSPCLTECDYAFVEDPALIPQDMQFDEIILCRWNRDYPADKFFNLIMSQYELKSTEEFVGNSHDEITIERYARI
jgi:hypothetical protein